MSDHDILDFLNGHEVDEFRVGPTAIAVNVGLSEGTVWNRVRVLNAADLLERTDEDRGYYRITGMGQRYLTDDLMDEERQQLEDFDPSEI